MFKHSFVDGERSPFLQALCAVAEGATVVTTTASRAVAALLVDPEGRGAALGGRADLPRSLASLYACFTALFLYRGAKCRVSRSIKLPRGFDACSGIAVTPDGALMLLSTSAHSPHAITVVRVADGQVHSVIGEPGRGKLQFLDPRQLWIPDDGFVFVADSRNNRVHVLTPSFDFHSFLGAGPLRYPVGVCADQDVVVVAERDGHCICVFRRCTGSLLRRFGSFGTGDNQLQMPGNVCFMSDAKRIAVVDSMNCRISVFHLSGAFERHVRLEVGSPLSVACVGNDELVVSYRLSSTFTTHAWLDVIRNPGGDVHMCNTRCDRWYSVYVYKALCVRGREIYALERHVKTFGVIGKSACDVYI